MEIPRHWRLKAQRYRLEGSTCQTCGQCIFPPRPVCPQCSALPQKQIQEIFLEPNVIRKEKLSSTGFQIIIGSA